MLPICSPAYRDADSADGPIEANTIIRLADTPGDWAAEYPAFLTRRSGPAKSLKFFRLCRRGAGCAARPGHCARLALRSAAHWLLTGALVPASETLSTTRRLCELVHPHDRSIRPVVSEIRDWIIEQMHTDMAAIDRLYPRLRLMQASY